VYDVNGNCALDIERNDPIQSRSAQTDIRPSRKNDSALVLLSNTEPDSPELSRFNRLSMNHSLKALTMPKVYLVFGKLSVNQCGLANSELPMRRRFSLNGYFLGLLEDGRRTAPLQRFHTPSVGKRPWAPQRRRRELPSQERAVAPLNSRAS